MQLLIKLKSTVNVKKVVNKAAVVRGFLFDTLGYNISLVHFLNWLQSKACQSWLEETRAARDYHRHPDSYPGGQPTSLKENDSFVAERKQGKTGAAAKATKKAISPLAAAPTTLPLTSAAADEEQEENDDEDSAAEQEEEEDDKKRKRRRGN